MGFSNRQLGVVSVVLFLGSVSLAVGEDKNTQVTVLVDDSAHVGASALSQAEYEAARIFRQAGVDVTWVDCSMGSSSSDDDCRVVPGSNQFVLHIVPNGRTSKDSVFGVAFLGEDGTGKYCNIFYGRIVDAHRNSGVSIARLLGTITAHELGHLLLGSHAHSHAGIMTPTWANKTLQEMDMGNLLFSREQSTLMQMRIRKEELRLAGVGAAK